METPTTKELLDAYLQSFKDAFIPAFVNRYDCSVTKASLDSLLIAKKHSLFSVNTLFSKKQNLKNKERQMIPNPSEDRVKIANLFCDVYCSTFTEKFVDALERRFDVPKEKACKEAINIAHYAAHGEVAATKL